MGYLFISFLCCKTCVGTAEMLTPGRVVLTALEGYFSHKGESDGFLPLMADLGIGEQRDCITHWPLRYSLVQLLGKWTVQCGI